MKKYLLPSMLLATALQSTNRRIKLDKIYCKEIQKVTEPESYLIKKIIRKKRDRAGNLKGNEMERYPNKQLCAIGRFNEMNEQFYLLL